MKPLLAIRSIYNMAQFQIVDQSTTQSDPKMGNESLNWLYEFVLFSRPWIWGLCNAFLVGVSFFALNFFNKYQDHPLFLEQNITAAIVFALFFFVIAMAIGLFDLKQRRRNLPIAALSYVLSIAFSFAFFNLVFFQPVSRWVMLFGALCSFFVYTLGNFLIRRFLKNPTLTYVICGPSSELTPVLKQHFKEKSINFIHINTSKNEPNSTQYEDVDTIVAKLKKNRVFSALLTQGAYLSQDFDRISLEIVKWGIPLSNEVSYYSDYFHRYPVESVHMSLASLQGLGKGNLLFAFFKRLLDIIFSATLLIALSPVFLLTAILIRITSPGPALFFQQRAGRNSHPFTLVKFRSMTWQGLKVDDQALAKVDDPRVTPFGSFIRKTHIDEIPQLINILKGEMSFIGPRPETVVITERLCQEIPQYALRTVVRPGLSGVAQILYRKTLYSRDESYQKLSYDLYYIQNRGLFLELWILLRTMIVLTKNTW